MSVRRSLALSFAQRYLAAGIYVVTTIILARLLTPQEVGVFSLCAAAVAVAAALREFGVSEYLIQERDLSDEKLRAAYAVALSVGWVMGAVLLLFRGVLADFYSEPGIGKVLLVLSLNFFLLPLATPAFALLSREMAFGAIFVIQTVSAVTGSLVALYLAWRGFSYMSLAWSSVAASATQIVSVSLFRPRDSWARPRLSGSKAVWAYCLRYSGMASVDVLARNAHEFIIAKQFGFEPLGLYSRASGLLGMFHENVTMAIGRVVTPALALDNRGGHPLRDQYAKAVSHFTAVAWSFFGFVACAAPEIVRVLLGTRWTDAAPLAQLMCIGSVVYASWAFAPNVLSALGQVKLKFRITAITSPLLVGLCFLGGLIDLRAVILFSAVVALVAFGLYSRYLNRLIGFSLKDFVRASRRSALVAVLVLAATAPLSVIDHSGFSGALVSLLAKTFIAGVAWLVAVRATRHPIMQELLRATSLARRKLWPNA